MEQCGDDEEFLHELLSDLRGEIDAQIVKIDEVLKVSFERHALAFWTLDPLNKGNVMRALPEGVGMQR